MKETALNHEWKQSNDYIHVYTYTFSDLSKSHRLLREKWDKIVFPYLVILHPCHRKVHFSQHISSSFLKYKQNDQMSTTCNFYEIDQTSGSEKTQEKERKIRLKSRANPIGGSTWLVHLSLRSTPRGVTP